MAELKYSQEDIRLIKTKVKKIKEEHDRLKTRYNILLEQIGFDSIEDARAEVERLRIEKDKMVEKANAEWDDFVAKYGEKLGLVAD